MKQQEVQDHHYTDNANNNASSNFKLGSNSNSYNPVHNAGANFGPDNHTAGSTEHHNDNNTISDCYCTYDPGGDRPNIDIKGTSTHNHDNLSSYNDTRYCDNSDTANRYNASNHNRTYDPGSFTNDSHGKLVHDPGRHGFNVKGTSTCNDSNSNSDTSNPLTMAHNNKPEHIYIQIQSIQSMLTLSHVFPAATSYLNGSILTLLVFLTTSFAANTQLLLTTDSSDVLDSQIPLQPEELKCVCYVSSNAFKDLAGVVNLDKCTSTLPSVTAQPFDLPLLQCGQL
jgi:hypothetical protein